MLLYATIFGKFYKKGFCLALKDNLKAIKTQLSTEEQFIENFIKGERFVKKYKLYLVSFIIILTLWFVVSFIMDSLKQKSIEESNLLYTQLILENGDVKKAQGLKEKNPNLYAIYLMQKLQLDPQNSQILDELKALNNDQKLNTLLQNILALNVNEKSLFLKDYDKILQAYELLKVGKIEEANVLLSQIKPDSSLGQIAKNLRHYKDISQ